MLVAGCVVYPLPEARWPGVLTILPILGSAMIVAARQGSREGGLLGAAAIQRVGDWSYSIYLWHWPVWVFALSWLSVRGYGVGATQKTLMVLLSLALGAISYRYVEQPFRIRRDFWTPRRLLGGSAVAFALLAGFVSLTFLNKGFPGRLPEYLLPAELARRTSTPRDECFQKRELHQEGDGDLLQFRQRAGGPKAVRYPVGRFVCQSVSRPCFLSALAIGYMV